MRNVRFYLGTNLVRYAFNKVYIYLIIYLIGYLMFDEQRPLKELILDLLTPEGKSISALSRDLKDYNIDMHKLILTGYLRALADMNVLKEKDIPPSKLYMPVKSRNSDVYDLLSNCARGIYGGSDIDMFILHSMCKLFRRAVFFEELKRAGIRDQPNVIQASKDEKAEAKKILQRSNLKITDNSPAYVYYNDEKFRDLYETLLSQMLSNALDVTLYSKQTKQTTLFGL